MIKHVLLMAVLTEMDRLAAKLQGLVETKPEEWQELYASYRRQIGLCMTELVNLAREDLALKESDDSKLRAALEQYRTRIARHQTVFPVSAIALDDPAYVMSFGQVHEAFAAFKVVMADLVDRYEVAPQLMS